MCAILAKLDRVGKSHCSSSEGSRILIVLFNPDNSCLISVLAGQINQRVIPILSTHILQERGKSEEHEYDSDVVDQDHQMGDTTNNIDTGRLASLHTQNLTYKALELYQCLELRWQQSTQHDHS